MSPTSSEVMTEHVYGRPRWRLEADWLAAELLVSRVAVLSLVRPDVAVEDAARRFGVSVELMRWRFNTSGAVKQVNRKEADAVALGRRMVASG